jgi:hypothetical protein
LVDTDGGSFNITLPDATTYAGQEIELIHISDLNQANIIGTVNNESGPFVLDTRSSMHLVSNGIEWFNLNYDVYVQP